MSAEAVPGPVAVVVPCRNERLTLERCLRSVRGQDPPPAQVVVVDNGSTDGSRQVACRFADLVVSAPDADTVSAVRNAGWRAAGDAGALAFLDADCEAQPGWLARGLAGLRDADLVGFRVEAPAEAPWVARRWSDLELRLGADRPSVWAANLMVRRCTLDAVGGFDESRATHEDVELCRRLQAHGYRVAAEPAMRVVHHGFPDGLAGFLRRERWHASTRGWWWVLSSRGRLLVTATATLLAGGTAAGAVALARRRPGVLAAYLGVVVGGFTGLGVRLGGGRDAPRDGLLLLVWGVARVTRLPRGLLRP